MFYFKILGICFGLVAALKPIYVHVLPQNDQKLIAGAYTKKRPWWVVPVGIVGLLLVAVTWYMELTTDLTYSLVISILFSLTAIKAVLFVFNYEKFQQWVEALNSKEKSKSILFIDLAVALFGIAIVLFSIFLL